MFNPDFYIFGFTLWNLMIFGISIFFICVFQVNSNKVEEDIIKMVDYWLEINIGEFEKNIKEK